MIGVAVIVPCYNLGRTLLDTLDSVQAQTRPATEVLVVDDGSDDPYTQAVLATLRRNGTQVVSTPNRGVAAARNLGVARTYSPYVVLLDADDVLEPAYVEQLAGQLDVRPDLDFVTCGLRAFGEADYVWTPPPCTWLQILTRGGPHVSTMWRRSLWHTVGGFDESLSGYEDLDFWLAAVEQGLHGEVIDQPLLRYRVRAGSRYRRAILPGSYVETMAAVYRKHPPRDADEARALLLEKEVFLEEQKGHRRAVERRRSELREELDGLTAHIRSLTVSATAMGRDALDWGDLRRATPFSAVWGLDRGGPLDRRYIGAFLERHRHDIRGRVLEIKDPGYATRFGGDHVQRVDVLDIDRSNRQATLHADLSGPSDALPADAFDCFILTQTLHIIYDTRAVIANAFRTLKPGGVLLCSVPCVSRVSYEDGGLDDGDFWRFPEASIRRLMSEVFPSDAVEVTTHGNVMTCAAFLLGLSPDDVPPDALDVVDPAFPLVCCIRAVKPAAPRIAAHTSAWSGRPSRGAVLLYHRVGTKSPDTHRLAIDTGVFRDQMRYVHDRCVPMPLDLLVEGARTGRLPERAVAVTFDDGYLDNLTVASPILLEYGLPATFFVNTDRLDTPHEALWDVLERVLTFDGPLPDVLDLFQDGTWRRPTSTPDERAAAHRALVEMTYPLSSRRRAEVLGRITDWAAGIDLSPRVTHRLMTGDELRELSSRPGHAIGAHTVHHPCLPAQSPDEQQFEIQECRRTLEALLDRSITAFAHPYGEYSADTIRALTRAGFTVGVTVAAEPIGPATQRLLVPRLEFSAGAAAQDVARLDALLADQV